MYAVTHPHVFSSAWFRRHQRALLAALRVPVIGRELRDVLAIRRSDVGFDAPIVEIGPHYYVAECDGVRVADFRTRPKFGRRLYYGFRPLWRAAHEWDRFIAEPLIPALDLGFSTLTAYPEADPASVAADAIIAAISVSLAWSAKRVEANADYIDASGTSLGVGFRCSATTNQFDTITRSLVMFDTSPIGVGGTVTAATLSLYGLEVYAGLGSCVQDDLGWSPSFDVYAATPASSASFVNADYSQIGSTSLSGAKSSGSLSMNAYNDYPLNGTGVGLIAPTGVSKFGIRESVYDVGAVDPISVGWSAFSQVAYISASADTSGSASDPKLVVTYSPANSRSFRVVGLRPGAWKPGIAR